MNKQELNNGFDSFEPTEEQKRRMLANIMSQRVVTAPKVINWRNIYIPACTLAAAVFIFALYMGANLPYNATNNDIYIARTRQIQTNDIKESPDNNTVKQTSPRQDINSVSESESKGKVSNTDKNSVEAVVGKQPTERAQEPRIIPDEVTAFALNINTAPMAPISRSIELDTVVAEDIPAYDEQQYSSESNTVSTITYDEFCDSINIDIKKGLDLPEDMVDISDSERSVNGEMSHVQWDVVYQGSDSRIIAINISTDTSCNTQYLEDDSYKKTDINGNTAVVVYDGAVYTAYLNKESIACTVVTNITEQELADMLVSMA